MHSNEDFYNNLFINILKKFFAKKNDKARYIRWQVLPKGFINKI